MSFRNSPQKETSEEEEEEEESKQFVVEGRAFVVCTRNKEASTVGVPVVGCHFMSLLTGYFIMESDACSPKEYETEPACSAATL